MDDSLRDSPGFCSRLFHSVEVKYQYYLDRLTPFTAVRWLIALILLVFFASRIVFLQGFYIVAYAVGIYYLNLFLLFLTPSIDPALEFDVNFYRLEVYDAVFIVLQKILFESGRRRRPSFCRKKTNDEFRPFMRRLPEFKFWYSFMKATVIATTCTFFDFFDVPVFWPILVMYFIILTFLTMKRQIMHMIKYRYIPFTVGKPRMAGKEDTGKVVVG
ncbi:unnamed protein product [Caenorhabditis auriculariae]|uniref:Protein RER1 n=1 Tax=Caenorhabditis auriculariae TaxID=2777116 RepID=A0A8S1HBP3_9PELO|nr:unnamed protein product [Caenorhabditis auriculariae]